MNQKVIRWPALALAGMVILGLFLWAFWRNGQDLEAEQSRQAALQRTLTTLQNNQVDLTAQLAQIGTNSYIEYRAREDYAFLKPGELRFEIVNEDCLENYTEEEMNILMQELVY